MEVGEIPKILKKLARRLSTLSLGGVAVMIVATILEGIIIIGTGYFGFIYDNFTPFYMVLAGSGWYAYIIDKAASL